MIKSQHRLFPVGRLDQNSTGLILLTNDSDLTLKLTQGLIKLGSLKVGQYRSLTEKEVLLLKQA